MPVTVRARTECERIAGELREHVAWMQAQVDEIARRCREEVARLDEEYCRALPELPQSALMVAFSRNLPGLIARRFEALIKGNSACGGTFESGYELLQSGKVDLLGALECYTRAGPAPINSTSPQRAA